MIKIILPLLCLVASLAPTARADEDIKPFEGELTQRPVPIKQPVPEYPMSMRRAGLVGTVVVDYIVDHTGRVAAAQVVQSNNPWFERPVLDALMRWRFNPGRVGDRPVNCRVRQSFPFQLDGGGEMFWQVKKSKDHAQLPEQFRWDIPPEPVNTAFPVYPFEDLRARVNGKTHVRFIIDPKGKVAATTVLEASTPAMGRAAAAMVETWEFKPARRADGTPMAALFALVHEFKSNGNGGVPVSDSAAAILHQLKKSPASIAELAQLDAPPRPLSQRPPRYPVALREAAQPGEAVIEFFIDRAGDAQLPRVVSATAPEFGAAAAHAIATWRYTPPLRQGKPVTVRVLIPVQFNLQEEES